MSDFLSRVREPIEEEINAAIADSALPEFNFALTRAEADSVARAVLALATPRIVAETYREIAKLMERNAEELTNANWATYMAASHEVELMARAVESGASVESPTQTKGE